MPIPPDRLVEKAYHASMIRKLGADPVYPPLGGPGLEREREAAEAFVRVTLDEVLSQVRLVRAQWGPGITPNSAAALRACENIAGRILMMRPQG